MVAGQPAAGFMIAGHVHVAPASGGLPKKISDFAEEASAPSGCPTRTA